MAYAAHRERLRLADFSLLAIPHQCCPRVQPEYASEVHVLVQVSLLTHPLYRLVPTGPKHSLFLHA